MQLTYLGHSCFLMETAGKRIIIDPFISGNELAEVVKADDIKADYILLTHGHQDHILDAEKIAKNNNAVIVSNFEIATYYEKMGLKSHPMNHGGSWKFDFGTVKYTPAIHSSSFPDGTYAGNPGGFVINNEEGTYYFSGDTSLDMNMKLIPLLNPGLTFAVLPIGNNFTMDIEEAIYASDFLGCNRIIGCHFDTFGYIKIDKEEARRRFAERDKELVIMEIGEKSEF